MVSRILATAKTAVPVHPLPRTQGVSGEAAAGSVEFDAAGVPCGLWEHTVGTSSDIEVDEIFVVLAGRARIEIEGQPTLTVGPGDVVQLAAGARTTWHVSEDLRKFWVSL